jgi:ubiquinone/menaquinone biosynthesis C-methylase UbiE
MPSAAVLLTMLRELTTRKAAPRVPEPDLVMDDPEKVAAYTRAGLVDGVMAPVYLFHCRQICEVIRPGDTAVDLGCGPAIQLAMVAALNPHTRFIGIDLSDPMLARADEHIRGLGLKNVRLRKADMTALRDLTDSSADAVFSTVALHHLPTVEDLERVFSEVNRILKPEGGLYLVDFGHLKSEKSIHYFAHQYADRQPELFTLDYLYSLRAAFHLSDFRAAYEKHLARRGRLCSTFLAPFMVAVKSPARRRGEAALTQRLVEMKRALPPHHQRDFADLTTFFRLGGLAARR